jgi:hypothetical protein
MTGYVRKDTTNNIADGNVINAADLDNEFDGIQDAFNASTGHNHDGTSGEGAPITALGPTQDVTISATLVAPKTTNTVDIGSSALKFKDLFLAGNGSIGGTLAVTGVATFTAQPILSSLTASRAVFSDGSKGLVSNAITGTGNVVMSASPTLTGTIDAAALTASGAVTLSGGTANGVAYLNGSKVVTSGSALTFDGTNLGVGGGTTAYNNAKLTVVTTAVSGRQNLASIDKTTANWVRFTNPQFSTDASMGLILKSFPDSDSRQGAGIIASGGATNNSTNLSLFVSNSAATALAAYTATPDGTDVIHTWNSAASTEAMRLTSTGLGIGTSSPLAKLQSNNSSSGATALTAIFSNSASAALNNGSAIFLNNSSSFNASAYSARIASVITNASTQSSDLIFGLYNGSQGNDLMRLDSAGNLGLGVTPSAWGSQVKALQSNNGVYFGAFQGGATPNLYLGTNNYFNGTNWIYSGSYQATKYEQLEGKHSWFNAPSGTAGNAISFTQAMSLTADGNLLVGTTSATYGGQLTVKSVGQTSLSLQNSNFVAASAGTQLNSSFGATTGNTYAALQVTSGGGLAFNDLVLQPSGGNLLVGTTSVISAGKYSSSFAGATENGIILQTTLASTGSTYIGFVNSSSSIIGSVTQNGASTVAYNTSSDYRLKNTITPMTGALAKVALLKPVTYKWNADGSDGQGFIAHELQSVVPECVTGEKDGVDANGNPKYQGIDTSFLVATLTAAIQEQQAIIESLKARLDAANL